MHKWIAAESGLQEESELYEYDKIWAGSANSRQTTGPAQIFSCNSLSVLNSLVCDPAIRPLVFEAIVQPLLYTFVVALFCHF